MARNAKLLLNILEELVDQELVRFQWHLCHLDSELHIPKSKIKDKKREETVDVLVQTFGDEFAVTVTADVLSEMCFNQLSKSLREQYNNGKVDLKTGKGCEIKWWPSVAY